MPAIISRSLIFQPALHKTGMMESFRLQYIRCGKRNCGRCPHGPYWYAFWSEGGRTRSRYIGKVDPRVAQPASSDARPGELKRHHLWDAILSARTATMGLACTILEITEESQQIRVEESFRRLSRIHHPDRGGDAHLMLCVSVAFSFVMKSRGWK